MLGRTNGSYLDELYIAAKTKMTSMQSSEPSFHFFLFQCITVLFGFFSPSSVLVTCSVVLVEKLHKRISPWPRCHRCRDKAYGWVIAFQFMVS